jgi:hypothetical protein
MTMTRRQPLDPVGGLVGGAAGLGLELLVAELTGQELIGHLLVLLGAGFGMLRVDRRLYEATRRLVKDVPVEPDDSYDAVKAKIEAATEDLPELRKSFSALLDAGLRARQA